MESELVLTEKTKLLHPVLVVLVIAGLNTASIASAVLSSTGLSASGIGMAVLSSTGVVLHPVVAQ